MLSVGVSTTSLHDYYCYGPGTSATASSLSSLRQRISRAAQPTSPTSAPLLTDRDRDYRGPQQPAPPSSCNTRPRNVWEPPLAPVFTGAAAQAVGRSWSVASSKPRRLGGLICLLVLQPVIWQETHSFTPCVMSSIDAGKVFLDWETCLKEAIGVRRSTDRPILEQEQAQELWSC
eukprot:scpid95466/ scgid6354/ 